MVAKQLPSYYGGTKVPNVNDSFILYFSTVGIRSRESKRNTKNKDGLTMTANAATKKQDDSDPLILVAL